MAVQGKDGPEAAENAVKAELELTKAALKKNPKSYSTWHQRRWLVQLGVVDLQQELQLVTM
jgi:geranylgeranyl transferase type-2 subunit alpha